MICIAGDVDIEGVVGYSIFASIEFGENPTHGYGFFLGVGDDIYQAFNRNDYPVLPL